MNYRTPSRGILFQGTGVGDLHPFRSVPLPRVSERRGGAIATEEYNALAGGLIRHRVPTAGTWSDVFFLRPEPTFTHLLILQVQSELHNVLSSLAAEPPNHHVHRTTARTFKQP